MNSKKNYSGKEHSREERVVRSVAQNKYLEFVMQVYRQFLTYKSTARKEPFKQ